MKLNVARVFPVMAALALGGVVPGQLVWSQDSVAPAEADTLAEVADLEPAVDVGDLEQVTRSAPRPSGRVMDTLNLGTTSVTGSRELPKVLYIVPWKSSNLEELVGRPINTLLDEVLAPIDPEEFERHLQYYDALYGDGDKE